MFEIFVFGSFWFWTLVAAEVILLFAFVDHEEGGLASISVLIFATLLQFFGKIDIIDYVRQNPLFLVSCVVSYFALGVIWSIVKWWIFCRDKLEEFEEFRDQFLSDREITGTKVIPAKYKKEWLDKISYRKELVKPPQVRENKSRILRWMTFWVVSIIWSFINDFVKRVYRTIYQKMAGFLQSMSDKIFKSAEVEFEDEQ